MAIDTATKRRSVLGYALGLALVLPVADGSITAGDRAHIAGLYSGLSFVAEPSVDLVLMAVADDSGPYYGATEGSGSRYAATEGSGPRYRGI